MSYIKIKTKETLMRQVTKYQYEHSSTS